MPVEDRLHRLQGAREGHLQRLRVEAAAAELAECTFAPQMAAARQRCALPAAVAAKWAWCSFPPCDSREEDLRL